MPAPPVLKASEAALGTQRPQTAKPPSPVGASMGEAYRKVMAAAESKPAAPPAPATAPAPAPPQPAPTPATVPPVPTKAPEKLTIPDFKAPVSPAPPALPPEPTPEPPPNAEPPAPTPEPPPGSKEFNFAALEQQRNEWKRKAEETQARVVELEKKAATPIVPPDYEALKTEREEMKRKLEAVELAGHPLFKSAFDQKIQVHIDQAKEVAGEKAEAIESIMKMPAGKYRDGQLTALAEELEPFQQSMIAAAYQQQKLLERERQQNIENAPDTLKKIKDRELEVQAHNRQQERERGQLFASQELAIAGEKWEDFRPKTGDDAHNQQVLRNQTMVRDWMSYDEWTPDTRAKLAVWAARGVSSVERESSLLAKVKDLESQLAALSNVQPNPLGGGTTASMQQKFTVENAAQRYRDVMSGRVKV